jgi:hypothetical protein
MAGWLDLGSPCRLSGLVVQLLKGRLESGDTYSGAELRDYLVNAARKGV